MLWLLEPHCIQLMTTVPNAKLYKGYADLAAAQARRHPRRTAPRAQALLVQSRAVDDENLEGVRGRQSSQALLRGFGPRRAQNRAVLRRTLLPIPRRYERGQG